MMKTDNNLVLTWESAIMLAVLFLVNIGVLFFFEQNVVRVVRLTSVLTFFMYGCIFSKGQNLFFTAILFGWLLQHVSLQYYEYVEGCVIYVTLGITIYILIITERSKIVRTFAFKPRFLVAVVFIIAAMIYALYILSAFILESFKGIYIPALFYIYAACAIILGATAVIYNVNSNSDRSLIFMYSIFALLISDISSFLAYYFSFSILNYLDICAFLIGIMCYLTFGFSKETLVKEKRQVKHYNIIE